MKRRTRTVAYTLLALCGMLIGLQSFSQQPAPIARMPFRTPGNDSVKIVEILNADTYHSEQKDSIQIQYWVGKVRIRQGNTLIDCDSMIMNQKENYIESFGHVHITDDSTNIYSEYMKYLVDKKTVHFLNKVKMTDGKGVLTTEDLQYDLNQKVGVYDHGGKIVNEGSTLTSEHGTYYAETKDVYFQKDVVLRDPQYDLSADSLLYNTQTKRSTFITETFIQFKDTTRRTVRTKDGYYDLATHHAEFGKRPILTDGPQKLTGDSVRLDDSTGLSEAIGHAVYRDTVQGTSIIANYMISDKKKNTFMATKKPLMIIKQEKDSLYLTCDTLYSGRLVDYQEAVRKAAIMDSLHHRYVDSLYKVSTDSLHRIAVRDSILHATDTLIAAGPDSLQKIVVRDRSDSAGAGARRDSALARLDSTGKFMRTDSGSDSLKLAATDTTTKKVAPPPPPKGRRSALAARQAPPPAENKPALPGGPPGARVGQPGQPGPGGPPAGVAKDSGRLASSKPSEPTIDKDHEKYTDTAKGPVTDSSLRYILAFHHVRIFSDSLQAVADSLFYSGRDSIFRLFKNPIAWGSGNYQITGDTMYMYTKNKKASRLYVFENGLAINKVASNFYNQLKGTTINCYFVDGTINYIRAKGNAESIYYVHDDNNAYTGANKAHADIIDMIFAPKDDGSGKELHRVVFRSDVEGSMIPFKKINFDEMRLRGFKWHEDLRPKTKYELFE